jgi:hypothetical protein
MVLNPLELAIAATDTPKESNYYQNRPECLNINPAHMQHSVICNALRRVVMRGINTGLE